MGAADGKTEPVLLRLDDMKDRFVGRVEPAVFRHTCDREKVDEFRQKGGKEFAVFRRIRADVPAENPLLFTVDIRHDLRSFFRAPLCRKV